MKIFAAGIATETNTFSPLPTGLDDYKVWRRDDAQGHGEQHSILDLDAVWGLRAQARGDEFVPSLNAWAEPSGLTTQVAYENMRDEVLRDLKAALPVDVVLLMLHGAMVAQGYEDCEKDLIGRVRAMVGPATVIGVELDLHCNLTEAKLADADVVVTYKEYPHVDINERAQELFDLAINTKLGKIRPTMALFDCRMLGIYPTTHAPLRKLVDAMIQVEQSGRALSVSFAHGFQFADLPHASAKVLVVTNNDQALAQQLAQELGLKVYRSRKEIGFNAISCDIETAFARALSNQQRPVVVADQSDNTGAGAPGDATYVLQYLLEHRIENVALAIFYDPEVVKTAKRVGLGATLAVRLGGKTGPTSGNPLDLDVTVTALRDHYWHGLPQRSGQSWLFLVGDVAALHYQPLDLDIIVGSERCQCFAPSIFSDFNIDPKRKRILIPKSSQHFYTGFAPIAAEVIYMAGPGAVSPDPRRIPYRRVATARLYPWLEDPLGCDPIQK